MGNSYNFIVVHARVRAVVSNRAQGPRDGRDHERRTTVKTQPDGSDQGNIYSYLSGPSVAVFAQTVLVRAR